MARKASVLQRRTQFVRHDQEARRRCRQSEEEPFRRVNPAELVHPGLKGTSYQGQEDDIALKEPLGYLKVGSHEEPIFAPIPGFEHVFDVDPEHAAIPSAFSLIKQQRLRAQYPDVTYAPFSISSNTTRGVKRSRENRHACDDKEHDADEEEEPETVPADVTLSFHVSDIEALKDFYAVRFRELTMKPMRDIVTAWVKRLEPRRQQKYGPYQRYPERRNRKGKTFRKPSWWPASVPYVEPSHLKLQDLIPLAVVIMLVHREIDEIKRKQDPWIQKLKDDAVYLVTSKDTEHFSSSKGSQYNEAMKRRALEVILPSLFDVAQSHEDYVYQEQAYEGSGNLGPGFGKVVFWRHAPRPDRTQKWKRTRTQVKTEPSSEDDVGDETEPDEELDDASRSDPSSSFHSEMSYTEDAKMFSPDVRRESSAMDVVPNTMRAPYQNMTQGMGVTPVDQPMNGLRLENSNGLATTAAYPVSHSFADVAPTVEWQYFNQHGPGWFVNQANQVVGFSATPAIEPNPAFVDCAPINGLPIQGVHMPGMLYEQSPTLQASCPYPIPGTMAMHNIPMVPGCSPFQ